MGDENKKYIVITGASAGIGRSAARAFASREKNLVLVARREERLNELKNELLREHPNIDVVVKVKDLSKSENAYALYEELRPLNIETWINNAGVGVFGLLSEIDVARAQGIIHLNIEALTILSCLYVKDYINKPGSQLINISSAGGYITLPEQIVYCSSKFYICAFTEGLIHEMENMNAALKVKLLAPSATKTEFDSLATDNPNYDYDKGRGKYHTSEHVAELLLQLYDSDKTVGRVTRGTFEFNLLGPQFPYADYMHAVKN